VLTDCGENPCGGQADTERLTAREDSGEPSEVADLAARGPQRSSQRGPATAAGIRDAVRQRKCIGIEAERHWRAV
jgi:hypothetical protein